MNTRTNDLNRFEEIRTSGVSGSKDILEKIYKQSQNPEIERLRKLLIDAHKRKDLNMVELIGEELSKFNH